MNGDERNDELTPEEQTERFYALMGAFDAAEDAIRAGTLRTTDEVMAFIDQQPGVIA